MTYQEDHRDPSPPEGALKLYVAGPMQGEPEHGWPVFENACAHLRASGYEVLSPHEVNHGEAPEERGSKSHHEYMLIDVSLLLTCEAIVLLDGWHRSKGALIELNVAIGCGLRVFRYWNATGKLVEL